jgi:hypothetical protein
MLTNVGGGGAPAVGAAVAAGGGAAAADAAPEAAEEEQKAEAKEESDDDMVRGPKVRAMGETDGCLGLRSLRLSGWSSSTSVHDPPCILSSRVVVFFLALSELSGR